MIWRTNASVATRSVRRTWSGIGIGCLMLLAAASSHGQAYCSLRDPMVALNKAFPSFDHHRSIVREVSEDHRDEILDRLPFTIHRNELGSHTLYAAFDSSDQLLGLIHVRTERGRWGLTEIAWTLGPDLRVDGFRFQRSRESGQAEIESETFQAQVRGLGFVEIRAFLDQDGLLRTEGGIEVPVNARPLAEDTLRSALKTIAATEIVWGRELVKLRGPDGPG